MKHSTKTKKAFIILLTLLMVLSMLSLAGCGGAAEEEEVVVEDVFPTQPLKLVIPFASGGSMDLHGRCIEAVSKDFFEQPLVVELQPGAGGATGTEMVSKAEPDGHTLLFTINATGTIAPIIQDVGYTRESFIPVAQINFTDELNVIVPANSPFNTFEELIEYGKANPGELVYGSTGTYGSMHLPTLQILEQAGVSATHVPFDGGGAMITATVSGEVDFSVGLVTLTGPQIDGGNLKALAVITPERMEKYPDVPTLKELGYDVYGSMWRTIFVPAGTPQNRVDYLTQQFKAMSEDEKFIEMIGQLDENIEFLTGAEFQAEWDKEDAAMRKLLEPYIIK